jgi:hypothetical protein
MKRVHVLMCGLLITGLTIGGALHKAVADEETGPYPKGNITIEGKKPAVFNHEGHLAIGITCAACHHNAEHQPLTAEDITALGDKSVLKCVSCHNENFANDKLQKQKDVFHARCRECHKAGFNGKNGPSKCNDCHVKKKKTMEGC